MAAKKLKTYGCSVPGCKKKWTAGGLKEPLLCPMHYFRKRRGHAKANVAEELVKPERGYLGCRPTVDVVEALEKWHADEVKTLRDQARSIGGLMEESIREALTRRGYLKEAKR